MAAQAYYSLDNIIIASPCTASWDAMSGNDQVRFCGECKKNVFNLSELTRTEAEDLIQEYEGNLCAGYYKRTDGTILTADCPKGFVQLRSSLRKAKLRMMAKVLPALALLGVSLPSFSKHTSRENTEVYRDTNYRKTNLPDSSSAVDSQAWLIRGRVAVIGEIDGISIDTTAKKDSVIPIPYKLGKVRIDAITDTSKE